MEKEAISVKVSGRLLKDEICASDTQAYFEITTFEFADSA
jgi:hypothetical protein